MRGAGREPAHHEPAREPAGIGRALAGGTLRMLLGLPLLAVSAVSTVLLEAVNDLARAIEGRR